MLKLIPILLILIVVAAVIGCKPTKDVAETANSTKEEIKEVKENNPDELIGFTWTVSYIQDLDARILPEKAPSITFKEGNKASISLSVNNCFGSYKASGKDIKIVEEGCTEMCCDDDYDKKLLALIRANEFSYVLNGSKLVLSASNAKIVLSKN
jgi:heat shock protein HslJ